MDTGHLADVTYQLACQVEGCLEGALWVEGYLEVGLKLVVGCKRRHDQQGQHDAEYKESQCTRGTHLVCQGNIPVRWRTIWRRAGGRWRAAREDMIR